MTDAIFLSTLSLRRATTVTQQPQGISIFLSTLSLRRATFGQRLVVQAVAFLSTLSLRRATSNALKSTPAFNYFYPRSPCGERLHLLRLRLSPKKISIHALLAESDACSARLYLLVSVISIHALLAESDSTHTAPAAFLLGISIHALLAESDQGLPHLDIRAFDFYPRSPCGERPMLAVSIAAHTIISIHALLAESDAVNSSPNSQ